jgi:hypothetical protein
MSAAKQPEYAKAPAPESLGTRVVNFVNNILKPKETPKTITVAPSQLSAPGSSLNNIQKSGIQLAPLGPIPEKSSLNVTPIKVGNVPQDVTGTLSENIKKNNVPVKIEKAPIGPPVPPNLKAKELSKMQWDVLDSYAAAGAAYADIQNKAVAATLTKAGVPGTHKAPTPSAQDIALMKSQGLMNSEGKLQPFRIISVTANHMAQLAPLLVGGPLSSVETSVGTSIAGKTLLSAGSKLYPLAPIAGRAVVWSILGLMSTPKLDQIIKDPEVRKEAVINILGGMSLGVVMGIPVSFFAGKVNPEELSSVYKQLARKLHPDMGGDAQAFDSMNKLMMEVKNGTRPLSDMEDLLKMVESDSKIPTVNKTSEFGGLLGNGEKPVVEAIKSTAPVNTPTTAQPIQPASTVAPKVPEAVAISQPEPITVVKASTLDRSLGRAKPTPQGLDNTLYHETSPEESIGRIDPGVKNNVNLNGKYVSKDSSLALGQGGKGIVLEIDPKAVITKKYVGKPGLSVLEATGQSGEEIITGTSKGGLGAGNVGSDSIKSIIVKPDATLSAVERAKLNSKWTKGETLPDGSIRYYNPSYKVTPQGLVKTKEAQDLIAEEVKRLKEQVGGVTKYQTGEGKTLRASQNPPWYQKFYKANGQAPTKQEYMDLAEENLRTGKVDGFYTDPGELKFNNDLLDLTNEKINNPPLNGGKVQGTDKAGGEVSLPKVQPVSTPEVKPKEKIVEVPRTQLPVGTGKEKVSWLEARMSGALKSMTDEQVKAFGTATYNQMNDKEILKASAEYALSDPERAVKAITGEIPTPKGLTPESIFVAMINNKIGDPKLITKVATYMATAGGQRMQILSQINPYSPIKIASDNIQEYIKVREKIAKSKSGGKTPEKAKEADKKELKKVFEVNKPTKKSFQKFLEEIRC